MGRARPVRNWLTRGGNLPLTSLSGDLTLSLPTKKIVRSVLRSGEVSTQISRKEMISRKKSSNSSSKKKKLSLRSSRLYKCVDCSAHSLYICLYVFQLALSAFIWVLIYEINY